jgi:hypothetical protein
MWVDRSDLFPGAHEMLMRQLDAMIVRLKEEVDDQQDRCHEARQNYLSLAIRQALHPTQDPGRIEQRHTEIEELLNEHLACQRALRAKLEEYEGLVATKAEWANRVPAELAAALGRLARRQVEGSGPA